MENIPHIILVTRPLPSGKELCDEIDDAGGEPLLFPTIEIQPKEIPQAILNNLPQQDWVIFISPQSVYTSHFTLPNEVKVAAIGEGTAKALRDAGYSVAAQPKEEWNTEGLLALPAFQNLENSSVTIVRGVDGRTDLAEALERRGALVTHAIAYERMLPQVDTSFVKQLMTMHQIAVTVATSKDGLLNLKILLESVWDELKTIPVIVISKNLQTVAKGLGFTKILVAKNASHYAIITVLKKGHFMKNSNDQAVAKQGAKTAWGTLGMLISSFAFVVLFGGIYIANMRILHTQGHLATVNNQLVSKIDDNQEVISDLQKKLSDAQENFQTLHNEVTTQAQAVNNLQNKEIGTQDQWLVNEAQYLVKLANDNLQVGENIPLIISLLQNADNKLRDANEPKLVPVRKALAEGIAAFQAVTPVDVTGIYLKLSALNNEVDKLSLPNHRAATEEDLPLEQKRLPWWKRGLQQTWNSLKTIMVVRYNASGEMPFIAPSQQDFLYQNIHARYEQAMLALMNKQQAIYRDSLDQVQQWVSKYFLQDDPATQSQIANLKELQGLTISPTLPTLNKTLDAFHEYLAEATSNSHASTPALSSPASSSTAH